MTTGGPAPVITFVWRKHENKSFTPEPCWVESLVHDKRQSSSLPVVDSAVWKNESRLS